MLLNSKSGSDRMEKHKKDTCEGQEPEIPTKHSVLFLINSKGKWSASRESYVFVFLFKQIHLKP